MSKSCMEFFLFQTNSCLGTPKMLACFLNWKLHKHLTLISESCHSLCTPESWIKACMSPSGAMHGCAPVQSSMSSLPNNLSHCYASLSLNLLPPQIPIHLHGQSYLQHHGDNWTTRVPDQWHLHDRTTKAMVDVCSQGWTPWVSHCWCSSSHAMVVRSSPIVVNFD
jgi:hypothetical protein